MTMINFRGKDYQIKSIKYGDYRKLLKARKESIEKQDEYLMVESLGEWLKIMTDITDEDLNEFSLQEAMEFAKKVGEAQSTPLESNKKEPEAS